MDASTFKRVLTSFADSPTSVDFAKGKLLCEVRDEAIEATILSREGEIFVKEGDVELPAIKWITQRIARLPILAERIITAFSEPDFFISPRAELLDQLDQSPDDDAPITGDAIKLTLDILNRKLAGSSSVVYLTSDAGEGKTTLIAHLARRQAELFKRKESDWLLVPISLGGRPFLRFDDIVVGFLTNRLRFPLFYFDAFMELVKLGILVPVFDGFEEMFVQSSSGDALSAVGNLMGALDSSGTLLIAARKAYFEYQDVKTQARLFDSIGTRSVVFSRVSLKRWEKTEFVNYCEQRLIENSEDIYARVSNRLHADHPLLTRAVLVKRLLDVADSAESLSELLQKIGSSPNDYFTVFVKAIIEREACEKWIDTSGEAARPLLSVQDHIDLLAQIAQEMWALSTDSLKSDVLDLLTELFCESRKLPASVAFQVRERTKQHALIVNTDGGRNTFAFDHEEFKNFFLGEALGKVCFNADPKKKQELLGLLRKAALPPQAVQAAISCIRQNDSHHADRIALFLQEVAHLDGPSSFTHENVGDLLIGILDGQTIPQLSLKGLAFHGDILRDRTLKNITFNDCTFAPTSLENTTLIKCNFEGCHFERLDLHRTAKADGCEFDGCDFFSILPIDRDTAIFDLNTFPPLLRQAGFLLKRVEKQEEIKFVPAEDADIKMFRRFLRHFLRSTYINSNVVLRRLGPGAEMFIKNVIPTLIKEGVLTSEWIARDKQSRYHLSVSMERLNQALSQPGVTIDILVKFLARGES